MGWYEQSPYDKPPALSWLFLPALKAEASVEAICGQINRAPQNKSLFTQGPRFSYYCINQRSTNPYTSAGRQDGDVI